MRNYYDASQGYQYIRQMAVVMEAAPGYFMTFVLASVRGTIDREEEYDDIYSWGVDAPIRTCSSHMMKIDVVGHLTDRFHDTRRPNWAKDATEIDARRALENGQLPREINGT